MSNMLRFAVDSLGSRILVFCAVVLLTQVACASRPFEDGGLFDGRTSQLVTVDQVVKDVGAGDIVIVSESHGFDPHRRRQIEIMQALAAKGLNVSVGMEFFYRGQQPFVDAFLSGSLPETDFLKAIGWGGLPFAAYRDQVQFPLHSGGWTVALNAPRALTGAIAKKGVAGLSPEERAQLPVDFERGNAGYYERFLEAMGGHAPSATMERYFEAQSAWDEVMAIEAIAYLQRRPEQTLVIIVGDFHAAYGGGLGARLNARGSAPKATISQVNSNDYDADELELVVLPHPKFGPRGDAVSVAR